MWQQIHVRVSFDNNAQASLHANCCRWDPPAFYCVDVCIDMQKTVVAETIITSGVIFKIFSFDSINRAVDIDIPFTIFLNIWLSCFEYDCKE